MELVDGDGPITYELDGLQEVEAGGYGVGVCDERA